MEFYFILTYIVMIDGDMKEMESVGDIYPYPDPEATATIKTSKTVIRSNTRMQGV